MAKHQPQRSTFTTLLAKCAHVKKKKRLLLYFFPHRNIQLPLHQNSLALAFSHYDMPMSSNFSQTSTYQHLPTTRPLTNYFILSVQPYAPSFFCKATDDYLFNIDISIE